MDDTDWGRYRWRIQVEDIEGDRNKRMIQVDD